jgi:hypothetical protein
MPYGLRIREDLGTEDSREEAPEKTIVFREVGFLKAKIGLKIEKHILICTSGKSEKPKVDCLFFYRWISTRNFCDPLKAVETETEN